MVKTGVGEASPPPQDENTLLLHNKGSRTVRRVEFDICAAVFFIILHVLSADDASVART